MVMGRQIIYTYRRYKFKPEADKMGKQKNTTSIEQLRWGTLAQQIKASYQRKQQASIPSNLKGQEESVTLPEKVINAIKERMIQRILIQIEAALLGSKEGKEAYQTLADKIRTDLRSLQQKTLSKEEWERQEQYQKTISLGLPKRERGEKYADYCKAIATKWPVILQKLEYAEHELTHQIADLLRQKETLKNAHQVILEKFYRLREQVIDNHKRHIVEERFKEIDELGKRIRYLGIRIENLEKSKGVVDDIIPEIEAYREKLKELNKIQNTQTNEVVKKVSPQLLQRNRNRPNS